LTALFVLNTLLLVVTDPCLCVFHNKMKDSQAPTPSGETSRSTENSIYGFFYLKRKIHYTISVNIRISAILLFLQMSFFIGRFMIILAWRDGKGKGKKVHKSISA